MDYYGVRAFSFSTPRPFKFTADVREHSYLLTLSSFQPLYGKMSDIFGRKPCLLFGYAIFGLGCLWCGLARNMNELIVARVRQAIEDWASMRLNYAFRPLQVSVVEA